MTSLVICTEVKKQKKSLINLKGESGGWVRVPGQEEDATNASLLGINVPSFLGPLAGTTHAWGPLVMVTDSWGPLAVTTHISTPLNSLGTPGTSL